MIDDPTARENRTPGFDDLTISGVRRLMLPAILPDDFKAQKEGSGTRLIVIDVDRLLNKSGSSRYIFRYVRDVDTSTQKTLDDARARAEVIGDVTAPGGAAEPATFFVSDPRYTEGYFFLTAVDHTGNETDAYLYTSQLEGSALDDRIPGDVTHPQISENGEVINETNYSVLDVKAQAPIPLESFDRLQLFFKDYPTLGVTSEGHVSRYFGAAGGSVQFLVRYAPSVRRGVQPVIITNGSFFISSFGANFAAIAKPAGGDVFEAFGVQGTIASVSADGNTLTLAAAWTGPTVGSVGITDYMVIGQVRVFFVSVSKGGTHRPDTENAPYVDVVMDGLMSAPNAPTITGTVVGNGILIECEQLIGSQATVYHLWRALGFGTDFTLAQHIDSINADSNISDGADAPLQFRDSDFTSLEREEGQYFTYYVTAANARGQHSSPSNDVSISCRPDNGTDIDPGVIGRVTHKNLLFNAFLTGTSGATVICTDTSQDSANGTDATNLPGRPYSVPGAVVGTGRFIGFTRWESFGDSDAHWENGNEIHLDAPGVGGDEFAYQEVDAWDLGLGGARGCKVTKNGVYCMSFLMCHDGVQPNGFVRFFLEGYKSGTFVDYFSRQYRDASSDLQYYTGVNAPFVVDGSALLSTWTRYFAVFRMDSSIGTVRQVRFTWGHHESTTGVVRVSRPMFHEGESPSGWTGEMGDPSTSVPVPTDPPGMVGDGWFKRNHDGVRYIEP